MHDQSMRGQNVQTVIEQIRLAVPTIAHSETEQASPTAEDPAESKDVQALRAELQGLRQDLAQSVTQRAGESTNADADQPQSTKLLAAVPAMVPALSLNVRPTPDMMKLKAMLISTEDDSGNTMSVTSEKSKVGALGKHQIYS